MIIAVNYANEIFAKAQKINTRSAYKNGKADKVISFSPKDIDDSFRDQYSHILSASTGNGYWLWKPYFIRKVLDEVAEDGDYVMYADSGSYYVNKIELLISEMNRANVDIMPFEVPLIEKQFTKRAAMVAMECDCEEVANSNQILAGFLLLKKSANSMEFINQWLKYCCIGSIITDEIDEIKNYPEFWQHRHDQSILSLTCRKNNLIVFRDPSQYGDRPLALAKYDRLIRIKKYDNSNYPRIFVLFRKGSLLNAKFKESIFYCLGALNLRWENVKYSKEVNYPR